MKNCISSEYGSRRSRAAAAEEDEAEADVDDGAGVEVEPEARIDDGEVDGGGSKRTRCDDVDDETDMAELGYGD